MTIQCTADFMRFYDGVNYGLPSGANFIVEARLMLNHSSCVSNDFEHIWQVVVDTVVGSYGISGVLVIESFQSF